MGRLTTLKPKLQTLGQRIPQPVAVDRYGQGRGGRPWRRTRDRILARDGGLCVPCRTADRITVATEVDHITPLAQGGAESDENLQSICLPCHQAKTARESRG